jgi:hypothetical protein
VNGLVPRWIHAIMAELGVVKGRRQGLAGRSGHLEHVLGALSCLLPQLPASLPWQTESSETVSQKSFLLSNCSVWYFGHSQEKTNALPLPHT